MNTLLLVSAIASWLAILFLAFLLLGVLRSLELLKWQLQQVQATNPTRMGRGGLKPGKKAPEFKLPTTSGGEVALADYSGRRVLLVFVQTGCGPCHVVVPDLNRLHKSGKAAVLVINNAEPAAGRKWASEAQAEFPVALQQQWAVSKRYEVLATPFAFLIDEQGVVASKGIISNKQQIGFVLDRRGAKADEAEANGHLAENHIDKAHSHVKEVEHV